MPQGGFQSEKDFQDFQALNPMQQLKYLHATDPDFGKLSVEQKEQYVDHILGKEPPKEQSFGDKLTAGGSSPEAQKGDEWLSKHIPIAGPALGKGLRYLDAAGGTVMGIPGSIYHSFADPLTPEEQARGQNRYEAVPERLLGAEQTATALHDYGAGKVSPGAALSVLPEALGTGTGIVGGTEGLGRIGKFGAGKFGDISGTASNTLAKRMRYPATEAQSAIGKPGSVRPLPFTPDWLTEGLVPKGRQGTLTNPGPPPNVPYSGEKQGLPYQPDPHFGENPPPPPPLPLPPRTGPLLLKGNVESPLGSIENPGLHNKIPLRVPKSVLDAERAANQPTPVEAPIGSPENPGPMAKLPMRVPQQVLAEEAEARAKAGGAESHRDATLDRRNVPEFAGEGIGEGEDSPITSPSHLAQYGRIGGRARMAPPLRPLVGLPEDWQTYDAQKAILRPEASDAGLYSAARGAVRRIPDYQVRIGRTLRQFGPPEDLMEESTPPVRRKVENE